MSHLADAQSYLIDAEDAIANGQPGQTWLELSRIHALIAIAEHGAPAPEPAQQSQPEPVEKTYEEPPAELWTSDRDDLMRIIRTASEEFRCSWRFPGVTNEFLRTNDLACRILEAGYRSPASTSLVPRRVLTTAEDLNSLPDGAIVVDSIGDGGEVCGQTIRYYGEVLRKPTSTAYAAEYYGPFILVWQPSHKNRS
ncbi:hypothetical protein [Acidipropionibacterium jensenii]|uniref:hypothetical protein n=1 Tax=Acidipropionibacterium jensenii TaxID=1749 RepID=UPI00214AE84C|nr:hypothetical protein [Acidipropionibacterium jensenii]